MDRRGFLQAVGGGATLLAAAPRGAAAAETVTSPAAGGQRSDMSKSVLEPQRQVPVIDEVDVAVVGGGIAGVAAALAAARAGARTCLVEKAVALGGLATLGNVVIYLPICDGVGHQVIAGLGEELLRLSVRDGFCTVPACWEKNGDLARRAKERFMVQFNPASYMLDLEAAVVQAGVRLWYDTVFCEVVRQGEAITALLVENKSGRGAIACRSVVDASGDADVCARAGEATESLRTNVESGWFFHLERPLGGPSPDAAAAPAAGANLEVARRDRVAGATWVLDSLSKPFPEDPRKKPAGSPGYAGDDGRDVTAQILASRELTRRRLEDLRKKLAGKAAVHPVCLPMMPSFRMTRRLVGAAELQVEDDHRWFDDTVAMTGNWRRDGPVYCIPYRALVGVRTANLVTAGRCISSAGVAWDVTRVIPTCAVTGEAAGTAAAMSCRDAGGRVRDLAVPALQEQLRKQGVLIERALATR